jgi:hypothetical protein
VAAQVQDGVAVLALHTMDPDREPVRSKRNHDLFTICRSENELGSRAALGHHAGTIEAATVTNVELKVMASQGRRFAF